MGRDRAVEGPAPRRTLARSSAALRNTPAAGPDELQRLRAESWRLRQHLVGTAD